jgi:acetyl-CoA acyltransferase
MREVVVVSAVRTAIGKGVKGSLKDTRPDTMLAAVIAEAVRRSGLDPEKIDDVVVGTAMPEAEQGMNVARISSLMAGLPDSVPAVTINRFCSSGLQSLAQGAAAILAGWQNVVVSGGVESMSQIAMGGQKPSPNPELMDEHPEAYTPMGITAENVAERFHVSREDQDAFSYRSHKKAVDAIEHGRFTEEILPLDTRVFTDGAWQSIRFDRDEGPRPDTTIERLGKLKPAFKSTGTVTAGSSSQISDGAAAEVIAARDFAESHGLPILGLLKSYQVVGVPPEIMGVGPRYAIPKALDAAGLSIGDIDVFELNEAFASQALYCQRELGIPDDKLNPNGGAIALGHPLGCTGARMTATLLYELRRRKARYGVVSMCIGGGMGAAAVFENVAL